MTGSLQVKNGKYYLVLNTYVNGKRKLKWVATGLPERGNKRRAEELLRETLCGMEKQQEIPPQQRASEILFSDYVRYWLTESAKRVDPVTMQGYKLMAERHVLPYFDHNKVKLPEVTRRMLQGFLDEKSRCGRLDGKGGLSPKSIREIKGILHQTLDEAIRDEIITSNPCSLLRLPPTQRPEAKFYSVEQLNALLDAVKEEPLYPVIKTAIVYGLRRSELLGLKWDSIDFDNGTLTIKHTVVKVSETIEKDKTKSKSSHRSFPLLPEMREIFLQIRAEQKENRKLFSKAYVKSDYVFCWPDGRPFSPDYVSKGFSGLLKRKGFSHIRFHELRHSCASLLINQGFTLKDVQEWMGHSDISVTADIYGHLETKRKQDMASRMASCISK